MSKKTRLLADELADYFGQHYKTESPLKTLFHLCRGQRLKLAISIFFYLIKHSGVWLLPIASAAVINVITYPNQHNQNEIVLFGLLMAGIFALNIPSHYMYTRFLSSATRNTEVALRTVLTHRLQQLSMHFYYKHNAGALQTKLLRDVEMIEQLTKILFENLPSAIVTVMVALVTTWLKVPIFVIFFLSAIPITILLNQTLGKSVKRRNQVFRVEVESMAARVNEMIQLLPVARAHGIEREQLEKLEEKLEEVKEAGVRLDGINAIFGSTSWAAFRLLDVLCLVTAAWLAYTQIVSIQVGDVVMLTAFFGALTSAVSQIINLLPQIAKGFESITSLGDIMQNPDLEQNKGKTAVNQVQGDFTFENVSFAYPDAEKPALQNVSFKAKAGETVAFVGSSGSGKSTLINLLIGFVRPAQGNILLDGQNMNGLDLRSYRKFLSVVSQETVLFKGTIRENILYGASGIDQATLERVAEMANAREFIEKLPEGFDTVIGERGARLSGGQRQRIAIARALIRNPRILILDEATSALDTASEVQVQKALERLMEGRTTFVVAHRLSTIKNANRIIVLEQGKVMESGSHEELLNKKGAYYRMWNLAGAVLAGA